MSIENWMSLRSSSKKATDEPESSFSSFVPFPDLAEGFMGAVAFHPDAIQAYTIPDANTQLCTSDLAVSGASINDTEAGWFHFAQISK